MAKVVQVTAPVVVVRDEAGAQHYFYDGATLPSGLDGDHVKTLLDDGMVSEVDAPESDDGADKPATIKAILADVGKDKDKAAAALEEEKAKGDDARASLVEKLEAVLAA